jgi:iron complex transport system substrate-binding protein
MKMISRIALCLIFILPIGLLHSAQVVVPFTIQAEPEHHTVISALYQAYYDDVPLFVDTDADLIITGDYSLIPDDYFIIPHHFLPNTFILLQSQNPEAELFADFTISTEGQQVLIDAGFLPDSVTIVDQSGHEITLPQPVRGVVSAYSIATYLTYTINAQDRLLGADYGLADDRLITSRMETIDSNMPTISLDAITPETIITLAPDVVLTTINTPFSDSRIPTITFDLEQATPELLQEALYITGQVFGPHAAAVAQVWGQYYTSIDLQVLDDTQTLADNARPRVLMVGESPLQVISGDMYPTSMIEIAGGVSVTEALTGGWHDVHLDEVMAWNPDAIIIMPYSDVTVETFTNSQSWQMIEAVKQGNLYKMPSWVVSWATPIPESVLGIVWLAEILFEGQINLDCRWEVQFFYSIFYHYDIDAQDIMALCPQTIES